jgi:hypothetical protein
MDKQPSEALRSPAWRAEQVLPPDWEDDPTIFTRAELIAAIASQIHIASGEAYTVGQRDALEQACKAVCWMCRRGHAHDPNAPTYHRYKDGVHEYVRMCQARDIRALMSDTTKETTNE